MKKEIPPRNVFIGIWCLLIVSLFVMFGLAHIDLGSAGTAIILALAACQMLLVLAFFMRLRHGAKVVRVAAATGYFWLWILFMLVFADYLTRQWH